MKQTTRQLLGLIVITIVMLFSLSCEKKPDLNEKLYGTWSIKKASVYSIYSFRANGSWTSSNRVEGRFSRIIENKGKVLGQWEIEESAEEDGLNLLMTPTTVESTKQWKEGTTVKFKIITLDDTQLVLLQENGREMVWRRVRGKKATEDDLEEGVAKVKTGPIVVNLKRVRAHGKFRYLCLDLDLSVEDAESCQYIAIEKNKNQNQEEEEVKEPVYQLHPKIREVAIMYLSSLTYKETKTLDKVKKTIKTLQTILNPYFNGNLTDIYVVKVVVTSNIDSVKEFENMYVQQETVPEEG